jgi:hypothetical protein
LTIANIDIQYGFLEIQNAMLAISEFDNKKVVFFFLVAGGQSDWGTKWSGDKVTRDKVTGGTKW